MKSTPTKGDTNMSKLLAILIVTFTITLVGCGAQCEGCPPPTPSPVSPRPTPSPIANWFISIPLGNDKNYLRTFKPIFLGDEVESFKLRVRFFDPGRTSKWISGVRLELREDAVTTLQTYSQLPGGAQEDGSFWTDTIKGNHVWIGIFGVFLNAGSPEFQILEIERYFKPDRDQEYIPTANPEDPNVLVLTRGYEAIGISTRLLETQHYALNTWDHNSQRISIYVSPFVPELRNYVNLEVGVSTEGFKPYSDPDGWIRPVATDSGVYHEMTIPAQTPYVFVTIKSQLGGPYFLSYQRVRKIFNNITMERDEDLGKPRGTKVNALINMTDRNFPYGAQLGRFLKQEPPIDFRIKEMMVIASARMLDASDGLFRIGSADLHRNIKWSRNVDVQYQAGSGRANASWTRITMFEDDDLQEPISGGGTFHHEWGHFEYNMPDEYIDISGPPPFDFSLAVDPNSVMGTSASLEFCYRRNHQPAEEIDLEGESMWELLVDQYSVLPSPDAGGVNVGRYLDVLNKLEDLFTFTIH